ncbi:MAG: hypothetical protein Q7J68_00785 [Thermoplasmata archaeon]|nr:hypothetical protein [Thermoplasmata archaeon]
MPIHQGQKASIFDEYNFTACNGGLTTAMPIHLSLERLSVLGILVVNGLSSLA